MTTKKLKTELYMQTGPLRWYATRLSDDNKKGGITVTIYRRAPTASGRARLVGSVNLYSYLDPGLDTDKNFQSARAALIYAERLVRQPLVATYFCTDTSTVTGTLELVRDEPIPWFITLTSAPKGTKVRSRLQTLEQVGPFVEQTLQYFAQLEDLAKSAG